MMVWPEMKICNNNRGAYVTFKRKAKSFQRLKSNGKKLSHIYIGTLSIRSGKIHKMSFFLRENDVRIMLISVSQKCFNIVFLSFKECLRDVLCNAFAPTKIHSSWFSIQNISQHFCLFFCDINKRVWNSLKYYNFALKNAR